jgi:membrane-associated protease RseP (regulator of RpoE activity)
MGLLLLIVPMGAFVEPDEEALVKADKRRRMNVYAVGPATNIIVGLMCALIFSSAMMSSVEPVQDNPIIVSVADDGPAEMAGLRFGAQIMQMDGTVIGTYDDFYSFSGPDPGENVTVSYYYKGDPREANVIAGVVLTSISSGYPADEAGLEPGMIIYSLNDTVSRNVSDLKTVLRSTVGGQQVNVTALVYDGDLGTYVPEASVTSVTLTSRLAYYQEVSPGTVDEDFEDYGFMGINSAYMGAGVNDPQIILDRLATPFAGADDLSSYVTSSLGYIALPFYGLAPLTSTITDLYEPQGAWGALPDGVFWVLVNCAYWIFWINLMIGMTNVLPAVPLDGGYLFRDGLDALVKRFRKNASDEERVKYVGKITYALAIFVLFLILWQLIGPRLLG